MTHKLSPYAKELFDSGRGDMLLRDFFSRIIAIKRSKAPKGRNVMVRQWTEMRLEEKA